MARPFDPKRKEEVMNYYELDEDEKQELEAIENALESGEMISSPDFEAQKRIATNSQKYS